MKNPKFEIYTDKRGEFRFRLRAKNGEPILASEGYTSKSACKNGIASVKTNCKANARFDRKKSRSNKWFFNLKAANHRVIGTSEMYNSESSCENGIKAIMRDAKAAKIDDTTSG